ncbi:hypothetical protein PpBr36_08253 [Pyricularia pennisetigena]|uniref:hypothetical protein n=1 Tax=Pyricularia pennisetigena TaxID=1578925 RepID=UPI001151CB7C|nr:hypothetical protein PpBr36_08253 [Pyricularia pennisetigena]TLS24530.1 hypothetical protein PpBr36_08253 [Pyricularia pennisetigena]
MSRSLLSAHLEQIAISCQGINELPFPPPKIFTNALLASDDITSLIRDTETHERALFSVPPPPPPQQQQQQPRRTQALDDDADARGNTKRRQTVFNVAAGEVTTGPPPGHRNAVSARRNTAVAAVLGGDLHGQITRGSHGGGEVDIEVLLRGAEKLCHVYPLPGALERIPEMRQKYAHQRNTLAYYEARVAEQTSRLERMNRDRYAEEDDTQDDEEAEDQGVDDGFTEEDLRREEEEVRELDRKKKELQQRLKAMDKDLGGLLNI